MKIFFNVVANKPVYTQMNGASIKLVLPLFYDDTGRIIFKSIAN